MIALALDPRDGNGRRLIGRFRALLPDGRCLVTSGEPLFAGARALLALGVDPSTELRAKHLGSPPERAFDMHGNAGEMAQWTIEERHEGELRKRLWRASPFGDVDALAADSPDGGEEPLEPARVLEDVA